MNPRHAGRVDRQHVGSTQQSQQENKQYCSRLVRSKFSERSLRTCRTSCPASRRRQEDDRNEDCYHDLHEGEHTLGGVDGEDIENSLRSSPAII